jgi:hypothetical protein
MADADRARACAPTEGRVLIVAGMHRAGTSVVAAALQALGVDLGDRLMGADPRINARGFFEDLDVVEVDDALLAACGADWKSVALLDDVDWTSRLFAALHDGARRLLARRLARTGTFGFKDPRVARALPFWQDAIASLGASSACVIAVRHPDSVVDSLATRDRLDVRRSLWLWVTHLLCALHHTQGHRRLVVDYDLLLADPRAQLARVVRWLALAESSLASDAVESYVREFLTPALRHAEHGIDEIARNDVPLVGEVHRLAQRFARDEEDIDSHAATATIGELYGRLRTFAPLLAYAGDVEREADRVTQLAGELAWARSSLAESIAYGADLERTRESELAEAKSHADNLSDALARTREYNEDLRAALARKEHELRLAHARLAQVRQHFVGGVILRRLEQRSVAGENEVL